MKRLLYFLLGIAAITVVLGLTTWKLSVAGGVQTTSNTLTIYNWGEYIAPDLISKFEKQTGYHVNYVTFDSNEAMYEKVKQGGTNYDIIVPSDYMVDKMRSEGLLAKLDPAKIKGLPNIGARFLNQPFDPGNHYSVPYFWGTVGIVYNDEVIKNPPTTWEDLWSSQYRDDILMTDSSRDVMGIGLISQGFSVNSKSNSQVNQAYNHLLALTPNIKAYLGDEIVNYMLAGEAPLAVIYSGQASEMTAESSHLHYIAPKKTNIWFDNLCIPKSAKNKTAAYAFINFMLEAKNAADNADYVGYSTPNDAALKLLPKSVRDDTEYYPPASSVRYMEAYTNIGNYWTETYNNLYLQMKMFH